MPDYREKKEKLKEIMQKYGRENVAVAFSGGVDSALLLKMACEAAKKTGKQVYGIFFDSMLHPSGERKAAEKVAKEVGASFCVMEMDELSEAGIRNNPTERCYLCKRYLFSALRIRAEMLGAKIILEGTNGDDRKMYRPGFRAVRELRIKSPLADVGFTKDEVRKLAGEHGMSVSKKPSAPCLATRFPYGVELSYERLRRAEQGEEFIRELGFYNVRLRVHDKIARIEVDEGEIEKLVNNRGEIVNYLRNLGYDYVTVDLEGFRSGSMDLRLKKAESQ